MVAAAAEDGEVREDPRWRRSNTDCVFFLASHCTKGSECEYRHAEGARFNHRNCWYWFQGNCVNPSCTFRHPPLENLNTTKSSADSLSSYGCTSVKAANPCYFYYNSHCSKGDHCPFLHEPLTSNDDVGMSSKATTPKPAVSENYVGDEMIEASKDAPADPCQDTSCAQKGTPMSSNPEFDEAISSAPETSADTCEYTKSSTLSDQSSGDSTVSSTMVHTEQDEWHDSSPGFDVLVGDGLPNTSNLEHQLAQERDAKKVLHAEYDIADPVYYDLYYHDSEYYDYGQEFCGFDDRHGYLHLGHSDGVQGHENEITLGHIPRHSEITSDEYAKRSLNPRNFTSSAADIGFVHQHTQIRHISKRRPEYRKGARGKKGCSKRCRGLEPKNGSQQIESMSTDPRSVSSACPQPVVCATFIRQKKKRRGKEKQHQVLSAARSSKHPTAYFSGPKTLAQIKEEKCRSKSSFSHPTADMSLCRSFSDNFEGPKSLSELLKTKGRTPIDK